MAIIGKKTQIRRWNAYASSSATAAWEVFANVMEINPPEETVETIETTTMDTTGYYRTFMAALIDGGECSFTMHFTRAQYDIARALMTAREEVDFEIVLPDTGGTSMEFSAIVTGVPLTVPMDEKITVEVSMKITGEPTIDSGSGS